MKAQRWAEDTNPPFLIFMNFVFNEDESIKSLISRIRNAKSYGPKRIAEIDMLLSLLLFHLEEKSNYFSLCKAVHISPYGFESKKLLLNSINKNFKEEVEKNFNKLMKRNLDNHEDELKEEKLKAAVSAFIKFIGKIKRDYIHNSSYIKEKEELELTKEELEKVSTILTLLSRKNKKLFELLQNAFFLYYDALKEKDNAFSFLRFWIVVEMLIKAGGKLSNEEILKRASKIYNKELYGSLKLLYKKRNRIVHSCVFVSQDERNLLKSMAETILSFAISMLKKINSLEDLRNEFKNFETS